MRILTAINQKGGVGKTTTLANTAVTVACRGWRVLTVDLDPQGNLGRDFGYRPDPYSGMPGHPGWDNGRSLATALLTGQQPHVIRDVRSYDNGGRIDSVAAGSELKVIPAALAASAVMTQTPYASKLADLLAPLASEYDLVLVDCPPSDIILRALALGAANFALAPTRSDVASWCDGLDSLVGEIQQARLTNPSLRLLGIALFGTSNAPALLRQTREEIAAAAAQWFAGDPFGIPQVFTTSIRYAEAVAAKTRREGKTAAEIAAATAGGPSPLELLRRRQNGEDVSAIPLSTKGTGNVADDYERLVAEVLGAIFTAEQQTLSVTA